MDRDEARAVARAALAELRERSWSDLRDELLDRPRSCEGVAPSGTRYQVETEALWDDRRGGDLRVYAAVDDGGRSSWAPLTESFIVARDGSFVGE